MIAKLDYSALSNLSLGGAGSLGGTHQTCKDLFIYSIVSIWPNTVESRFKKARFKKESRFKKDFCYNWFFSTYSVDSIKRIVHLAFHGLFSLLKILFTNSKQYF